MTRSAIYRSAHGQNGEVLVGRGVPDALPSGLPRGVTVSAVYAVLVSVRFHTARRYLIRDWVEKRCRLRWAVHELVISGGNVRVPVPPEPKNSPFPS